MKKYIIPTLAIAAMMVSCNNAAPKMDEQPLLVRFLHQV